MDINNIKLMILDLDDTLVETYKNELKRVKKSAYNTYKIKIKKNQFNEYYGIPNSNSQMKKMLNKDEIDAFLSCFKEMLEYYKYKQIVKTKNILKLKREKIIIGVISNSRKEKSNLKMSKELKELMDFNYAVEDLDAPKPNAIIIKKILDKYSLKPEECVCIGDSIIDYEFSKNGQISFVKVESDMHKEQLNCLTFKNINKFIDFFIRERNKANECN